MRATLKETFRSSRRRLTALFLAASLFCAGSAQRSLAGVPLPDTSVNQEQTMAGDASVLQAFDTFTEELFLDEISGSVLDLHLNLADPTAYGITDAPITYGTYSLEQMRESAADMRELQAELRDRFGGAGLTGEQLLTYRILDAYLSAELSGEGLELYSEPLSSTVGLQAQLPILLAEYPFYSRQDVENYLGLLAQTDVYFAQILDFEREKSKAGLFMSDTAADHVLESCEPYLLPARGSILAETFDSRIDALSGLTDVERSVYKTWNLQILTEHFIPAYRAVYDGIKSLKGTGVNALGLCDYPRGKQYYEYLVRTETGTSYGSVEELRAAIEKQLSNDLFRMVLLLYEYPDLIDQLDSYEFSYSKPTAILNDLQKKIAADFPPIPSGSYTVKYVPEPLQESLSPAFYLVPPIDRYQDNTIYINNLEAYRSDDLYTTLAHEGYPGHLYQNTYFLNHNSCSLRHILSFGSYSEGWGTYAEHYAYTLDNGLEPGMGSLLAYDSSQSLALCALLDIYVNYDGWDKEQVREFLNENFYSGDDSEFVDSLYSALVENPANYLKYYTGYLEILGMRNEAQYALGDGFSLRNFHRFILDIGPAPFSVIRLYFKDWLRAGGR